MAEFLGKIQALYDSFIHKKNTRRDFCIECLNKISRFICRLFANRFLVSVWDSVWLNRLSIRAEITIMESCLHYCVLHYNLFLCSCFWMDKWWVVCQLFGAWIEFQYACHHRTVLLVFLVISFKTWKMCAGHSGFGLLVSCWKLLLWFIILWWITRISS